MGEEFHPGFLADNVLRVTTEDFGFVSRRFAFDWQIRPPQSQQRYFQVSRLIKRGGFSCGWLGKLVAFVGSGGWFGVSPGKVIAWAYAVIPFGCLRLSL